MCEIRHTDAEGLQSIFLFVFHVNLVDKSNVEIFREHKRLDQWTNCNQFFFAQFELRVSTIGYTCKASGRDLKTVYQWIN